MKSTKTYKIKIYSSRNSRSTVEELTEHEYNLVSDILKKSVPMTFKYDISEAEEYFSIKIDDNGYPEKYANVDKEYFTKDEMSDPPRNKIIFNTKEDASSYLNKTKHTLKPLPKLTKEQKYKYRGLCPHSIDAGRYGYLCNLDSHDGSITKGKCMGCSNLIRCVPNILDIIKKDKK